MIGKTLGPPNPLTISFYVQAEDGLPEWVSQPAPGVPAAIPLPDLVASEDLSTIVFQSANPLTADAPTAGTPAIYAVRDGQIELISRMPDGSVPSSRTTVANLYASTHSAAPPALVYRNQLSVDGSRVLFTAGPSSSELALYVRDLVTGTTRALVDGGAFVAPFSTSWSGRAPNPFAASGAGYVFASPDGSHAYFRSTANLAAGASGTDPKLYRADLATGALTYPGIPGPPVRMTDDGSRVMFLRPPAAADGPWDVAIWDAAHPDEPYELGQTHTGVGGLAFQTNTVRTTDDGGTWIFNSTGSLDPDRPAAAPATLQVYRWSVGDTTPTCLSCEPVDGVVRPRGTSMSQSEATLTESLRFPAGMVGTGNLTRRQTGAVAARAISDDGRRAFFDTQDRLVPGDENNLRDVYMWDADDGLRLVSSGAADVTTPSYYLESSPSGDDVFFATQDDLVPVDTDDSYDVYDARVGGGFPDNPDESCAGEACQPAPALPPLILAPGSPGVGPETAMPATPKRRKATTFRIGRTRGSTSRVTVRVLTLGPGRLRVSGRGLKTTTRRAKRATTYTLKARLSRSSRRTLAKKGRVTVRVRVRFTPASGDTVSKTVKLTIKRDTRTSTKGR
jgi:hypothetical protein